MRPSPPRKALSSREKVLRAATLLFAAKGFEGTSTRDVARKAKVNEITIFRLFKNKQDLYLRILDNKMGRSAPELLNTALLSSEDPEKAFLALAERLEEVFDPVFLRLFFYAALEKPELLRKRYGSSLGSLYELLGRHLGERIQSEVLRDIDPMLMGRALVGMIAYHRILSDLLGGAGSVQTDSVTSARIYTEIWLFGTSSWKAPGRQQRADRRLEPLPVPQTLSTSGSLAASGCGPSQEITPNVKRQ
jgi:AcrR family transcriptional regulator